MNIIWFILLLSLDLGDSAQIVQNVNDEYCSTNEVDIYADIDNVSQDTSLTSAEAIEKCRVACQSSYANSDTGGGAFTIGVTGTGCDATVDECRCRSTTHDNCAVLDRESYSTTCFEVYEFVQQSWATVYPDLFEIDFGGDDVYLSDSSGDTDGLLNCITTHNVESATQDCSPNCYKNGMNAQITVLKAGNIVDLTPGGFSMETQSACSYDSVSIGSTAGTAIPGQDPAHIWDSHQTSCKQNAAYTVDVSNDLCTTFCGTQGPAAPGVPMLVGNTILVDSDGSVQKTGFTICMSPVPASSVMCVASSDPTDNPPDEVTGEFYCVDGTVSGLVGSGCTCTPYDCIIQSPMTESWHKNCRSDSTATGTAGNCKCSCVEDAWGGDKSKGGRCIGDVDECDNSKNGVTFPHRAAQRCSGGVPACTNLGINNGYECACANGFETATSADFASIGQTECLDSATIAAVQAIVPPSRPYGTAPSAANSYDFLGAGCIYYNDRLDSDDSRVLFNSGTFVSADPDEYSYAVCKCADCVNTYHLATDPFTACSAYTPVEGHACKRKDCVVADPASDTWEIACANGDAAGVSESCTCTCPSDAGGKFQWEGTLCETDVNECTETDPANAQHNCDMTNGGCTNTDGGFTCTCKVGYTLNADGFTCDPDQCTLAEGTNWHCDSDFITDSGYSYFADGYCSDWVYLQDGIDQGTNYPTLLNPGDQYYSADRIEECQQRCQGECQQYTHFFIRQSDNRCACATACGTQSSTASSYLSYSIDTPPKSIGCLNDATASGTTGSCGCDCKEDGFGKKLWFGGVCGSDVNECTNTNPERAFHQCTLTAQCINEQGGHDCNCASTANQGGGSSDVIYCANGATATGTRDTGCGCDCSATGSLWHDTNCDQCNTAGAGCVVGVGQEITESGACLCICPLIQQYQNNGNTLAVVYMAHGETCENDVNECTNVPGSPGYNQAYSTNDCSADATCTNLQGTTNLDPSTGWSCACNYGYEGDGTTCTLKQCVQSDGVDPLEAWEINCVNGEPVGNSGTVEGGPNPCACDCPTAYHDGLDTWKFLYCGTDVDECTTTNPSYSKHNCSANAACTNNDGGFSCACNTGYSGDGYTCNGDACVATANFLENNPSEGVIWCSGHGVAAGNTGDPCTCVCDAGYTGTNCETTLQCTLDTVDDGADDDGDIYCKYGAVTGDYFNCGCICFNDFSGTHCDECVPATPGCQNGATAADNGGNCVCVCPTDDNGLFQWYGGTCGNNVNECDNTNPARAVHNCHTFATCTDDPLGTFSCACNAGYSGNGTYCAADDCVLADPADDPWEIANCQNDATAGGTTGQCFCDCAEDFFGLKTWYGGTCGNDVDECLNTNPERAVHNCSTHATCGDINGGFTCTCNPGYEGDGVTCTPAPCEIGDPNVQINYIDCVVGTATGFGDPGPCQCVCPKDGNDKFTAFGQTCQFDVNECTNQIATRAVHDCSQHATCNDTLGGFDCDCNPGYSGDGVICMPDACVSSIIPQSNHIACLYGLAAGVADACSCNCFNGFSGPLCNECEAGKGFNGTHCVACDNREANDLTTHAGACAPQQCDAGDGVVTDSFDFTLDPTDINNANCELCTGKQASPAGNGVCITQTCGDDQQVTTFPQPACQALGVCFDNTLDPTTPNANCIPCDAGFTSDAGVDPTCNDIDECISTDNPNFPQLCDFNGILAVGGCNTDDGPNTRNCVCKEGYTGDRCQININECDPNPCENGGSCVDGIADYTCICPMNTHESNPVAGWTGKNCTDDVNECDSFITNDCDFGEATCTNTPGDFTCACNAEYNDDSTGGPGRTCTIKPCELGNTTDSWTIDCNGRGVPNVGTTAGSCSCACTASNNMGGQAWGGLNCEQNLNECIMSGNNNCDANAQCTDTVGDFFCTCDEEYNGDGVTCDLKPCVEQHYVQVDDETECLSSEVINAVQALVAASSLPAYSSAPEQSGTWNYIAENCVYYVNDNSGENRVLFSTTPNTANDPARRSYHVCKCETCADKYALLEDDTLTCDSLNQDSWTINCNGRGNAIGLAGSCGCDCNATNSIGGLAWEGTNCEVDIDECATNNDDCDPDATCTDTDGDFTCACNTGYEFAEYAQIMTSQECFSSEVINAAEFTIVPAKFGPLEQYGGNPEGEGTWNWVYENCVYYTNINSPSSLQQQNRLVFSTTPQTATQNGKTSYPVCRCETCTNDKYDILTVSGLDGSCDDLNFKTCTESDCVTSNVPTSTPGEMYCLHGNATGVTGSCGCVCEDGWEGTNCDQDINECATEIDNCLPYHMCNNTPGSYFCWCKFGFITDGADYPLCTCDVGKHYNASEGTCRECEYPTTNDQQNSECVHAECLQNQYIEPDDGSFTNFLPFDHVSNCDACWPGRYSDDPFSTECDDTNECLAGIAATCGEFDDNGVLVPMGSCNESSQDDTIALTYFRCTANEGFTCPANNGPCFDTQQCAVWPCGFNSIACDDTYTASDPNGFTCTCAPGYSGTLCEIADPCNATLNPSDTGFDGNYYCRYGVIGGTTGTCTCTCHSGFTGSYCDVCVAGSGFFNDTCELCSNPFTNDQVTHDAPCVNQSCGVDRGIVIDGLAFDNTLDGNVDNANCEPCPPGMESPDGSGICSAIICGPNEKVVNHACVPCEMGALNLDGGDDASGNNTECQGVPCFQNERVESSVCVACPPGTTNDAGDLRNGPDTYCDPILCLEDEKVVDNQCVPCQPGAENEAGDDASGANTACTAILCDVNEYVSNHNCTPCAPLYVNLEGDDATQPDTQCILGCLENEGVVNNVCVPCEESYVYPGLANPEGPDVDCIYEGTCGSNDIGFVWCDENNTYVCANDMCACKPGFVGRECTADAIADDSPSTQKKLDLVDSYAPEEALPDDDTIIIFQQNVAVHLSDIVTGFVQQGGNTIDNVFQHTVEINRLTKRQQVAVGDRKTLLAAAPMLDDDDCAVNGALSRHCSSFNYKGVDDIVFLQTPKGFWSIVVKSDTLVSKQTSINNTEFEMQCWVGSGWGPKVTRYRDDLVMCNGFVLLMGSQAPICQATVTEPTGHILPGTCGLHGQCAIDGLSYTCVCSPGFTGEFCEEVYVQPTHCHEVDCNNYGGHNASVGLVPTPMLQADLIPYCCQYDSRAEFDAVCDAETQAQAYANLGCCSRTFCV